MNRIQVEARLRQYLKSHFINFEVDIDNGDPRYTMVFQGYDSAPNKAIESCIWLYDDEMEVRTYYPQVAAEWCKEHSENRRHTQANGDGNVQKQHYKEGTKQDNINHSSVASSF